jgi:hypothetical protein
MSSVAIAFLCALTLGSLRAYAAPDSDPCSLLTQQQVGAVLGTNVEAAHRIAPKLCEWSTPSQPNSMNAKKVAITISNERAYGFAKTPIVQDIKAIAASGICDDAVYSVASGVPVGPNTSLYVKKGASYFVVHVYGFPDQSKVMGMEKTLAVQACSKL